MINKLDKIPKKELASIWCDFNKMIFPVNFESLKPSFWDAPNSKERIDSIVKFSAPIMKKIEQKIGKEAIKIEWMKGAKLYSLK